MIEANTKRLLQVQIGVALAAIAITAFSLYELGPLSKRQAELKADIAVLEAKRSELQRDNEALAHIAKPAANKTVSSGNVDAWLYVGRISDGRWAPLSEGVAPAETGSSLQDVRVVLVKKQARLIGRVDNTSTAPASPREPVQFVKADTKLAVTELKTQPSGVGGTQIWVKVSVPPDRVLEIASP